MEATVLTLAFDPKRGGFPAEELEDFCLNKEVKTLRSEFFVRDGQPYWTVFIEFERVVAAGDGVKDLSPVERKAYEALAHWRKEAAKTRNYPAYLIATNKQLVLMVRRKARSKAALDGIKGFGRKRIAAYGDDIIHILSKFFDDEPADGSVSGVRKVVPDPQLDPGSGG